MGKTFQKLTFIITFIIICLISTKVHASPPKGTFDSSWEQEEVELNQLTEILSGVNELAKKNGGGDTEAAQELLHKMTRLELWIEKYLLFGEYLTNISSVVKYTGNNITANPYSNKNIPVRQLSNSSGRRLRLLYRDIDNEYTENFLKPIWTRREGGTYVTEAKELASGYQPSYCCWHWAVVRGMIQIGDSVAGDKTQYYANLFDRSKGFVTDSHVVEYDSLEDCMEDGIYSNIIVQIPGHTIYVEALVGDVDTGYAYTSETGSGSSTPGYRPHYYGVKTWKIKTLENKATNVLAIVGGDIYEATASTEDDSDLGGILLNPFLNIFNALFDAIQTIVTRCMTGEWRWVMVGSSIEGNLSGTEAYAGQFKRLQIWAANESASIDGWPEDIQTDNLNSEGSQTEGLYREEISDSSEKSLDNSGYFVNATGYGIWYTYPQMIVSPEELFSGKIAMVDANFFSTEREEENALVDEDGELISSDITNEVWIKIKGIVGTWFRALRYAGLVALLSVLIYIGIKVMLSSTARDKSKYKDGIANWVMAMLIMFLLPYIMSFIFTLSDSLIEILNGQGEQSVSVYAYDGNAGEGDLHEEKMTYTKFTTNLMGLVRFQAQSRNLIKKVSYMLLYFMMVIYTVKFSFIYLKRFIYMAFLVILSPIVAVMYAVDKIKGGSSHTFDMWLKEFTFNVLIQPVHMLLYYILIASAMTFATSNPVYVIVVFGFIRQSEKILKKIFGMDKSPMGTVGGISNATKNAVTFHNLTQTANNVKGMIDKSRKTNVNQNNDRNNNNLIDSNNNVENRPDYARDFNNVDTLNDNNNDNNENDNEETSAESIRNNNIQQREQEENEEQQENNEADTQSEIEESQQEQEEQTASGQQEKTNRFKAAVGTLGKMVNKRRQIATQGMKYKMSQLTPKKVIKGVGRGLVSTAKVAASATVGAGAVLGQAAISLAMDGKYSLLEGAGTFAAATVGTNSLFNKAGKKVVDLSSEYKQIKNGEEALLQQQREKVFWSNSNNIAAYQSTYGEMGDSKLSYELNRGANIAKNGITDVKEQMQVTAFADKLADETFNSRYSNFETDEDRQKAIQKKAQQLRQNGDKNFVNMTDEDVVKADIIKEKRYDELATNTLKAKKEIPESVRNADKKQRDAWIKGQVADDEKQAEGMRMAIEMTHRMDSAQVDRKQVLQKQRKQYENLRKSKKK